MFACTHQRSHSHSMTKDFRSHCCGMCALHIYLNAHPDVRCAIVHTLQLPKRSNNNNNNNGSNDQRNGTRMYYSRKALPTATPSSSGWKYDPSPLSWGAIVFSRRIFTL